MNTNLERLSSFGQSALKLDHDFSELERLSGQLERLSIDTEAGLDLALKILNQFAQQGQGIGDGIQALAKALEEARERAERAAAVVTARAELVQKRNQERAALQEKLGQLGTKVRETTDSLGEFKKPASEHTDQDKIRLSAQLLEVDTQVSAFIEEANAIRQEARQSGLRTIERSAESLQGTLSSARAKLGTAKSAVVH